jgi:hypothetical protein
MIGLSLHAFDGIMRVEQGDKAEQQAAQEGKAQDCDGEIDEYYADRLGGQRLRKWFAGRGRAPTASEAKNSAKECGQSEEHD